MSGYSYGDGEELATERANAIMALRPFIAHAKDRCVDDDAWNDSDAVSIIVSIGELRAALAADDPLL